MAYVLVNLNQTAEERREKYWLCRSLGCNSYRSTQMKDWRLSKIERLFHLKDALSPYAQFRLFDISQYEIHK